MSQNFLNFVVFFTDHLPIHTLTRPGSLQAVSHGPFPKRSLRLHLDRTPPAKWRTLRPPTLRAKQTTFLRLHPGALEVVTLPLELLHKFHHAFPVFALVCYALQGAHAAFLEIARDRDFGLVGVKCDVDLTGAPEDAGVVVVVDVDDEMGSFRQKPGEGILWRSAGESGSRG